MPSSIVELSPQVATRPLPKVLVVKNDPVSPPGVAELWYTSPCTAELSLGFRVCVVPSLMLLDETVPKVPLSTGLLLSEMATGVSSLMSLTSTENPNGSLESTLLLVIRSLATPTESMPSLLRSLPLWSVMRNSPPPFCTNVMTAVFSDADSATFGSGSTNTLKLDRSRSPPPPYVMVSPGGSVSSE